jgi:predicted amidophosphoribosyltransferase
MDESARFCPVCGQLLDGGCPNRWCRRSDRAFSVAFSVGVHKGELRRAITRYKYRGETGLAAMFAKMVAGFVTRNATWFEEFDLITAVPGFLGPGARRGWDPVGSILGRLEPLLQPGWRFEPRAVVKRAEVPGMAGRSWAGRQALARGPLRRSLSVPDPSVVAGCQVLVLDDVFTEGSTLQEVARALRRAGASDVAGLVVARPAWIPAGRTAGWPPSRRS